MSWRDMGDHGSLHIPFFIICKLPRNLGKHSGALSISITEEEIGLIFSKVSVMISRTTKISTISALIKSMIEDDT